jgi:hypothetical protein
MRKTTWIGMILAITIVDDVLSAIGHKTEEAKHATLPAIDPTQLTLAVKGLPTAQVDEPF